MQLEKLPEVVAGNEPVERVLLIKAHPREHPAVPARGGARPARQDQIVRAVPAAPGFGDQMFGLQPLLCPAKRAFLWQLLLPPPPGHGVGNGNLAFLELPETVGDEFIVQPVVERGAGHEHGALVEELVAEGEEEGRRHEKGSDVI